MYRKVEVSHRRGYPNVEVCIEGEGGGVPGQLEVSRCGGHVAALVRRSRAIG